MTPDLTVCPACPAAPGCGARGFTPLGPRMWQKIACLWCQGEGEVTEEKAWAWLAANARDPRLVAQ